MASSYFVTFGDNRLTFPGATGSVAWEYTAIPKQSFWVTSDDSHVYVTGTVYDANGNAITSLVAHGGSASAEFPSAAVSARMTASAGDYYATLFNGNGGSGFTYAWTKNGRAGTGTVQYSGSGLVLGSHSGQLNKFTASGNFATDATARQGWMMPSIVTYVHKAVGTYYSDVSATRNLNMLVWTAPYNPVSYPTNNRNALSGTYSSISGYVKMVGSSYRRLGNGSFGYPMYGGGPKSFSWTDGAGSTLPIKWATTTRSSNYTFSSWSPGTGVDGNGNSKALWICDYYDHTAIYTVCTGTWAITGIAK